MCGLVGFVRTSPANVVAAPSTYTLLKETMATLLYVDTLRGLDATGVAWATDKNVINIYKDTLPGYHFIKCEKIKTMLNSIEKYPVVIGHNRHATMGDRTSEAAHPFRHKHIVGAHNGTLRNETQWNNVLPYASPSNVDSARLIAGIAEMPIKDIFSSIQGAYALTWLNLEDTTLNILRNNERPLYIIYNEEHNVLLWSSEKEIAMFALDRAGMDHNWVYPIPINHHFSVDYSKVIDVPKDPNDVKEWFFNNAVQIPEYTYSSFHHPSSVKKNTTTVITRSGGSAPPQQIAGPLSAKDTATVLSSSGLQVGQDIRVEFASYHPHVITDKNGTVSKSTHGIVIGNYKRNYPDFKKIDVMLLAFNEKGLMNNNYEELVSFTVKVKAAMFVNHPSSNGVKQNVILCENKITNPIYRNKQSPAGPVAGTTGERTFQGYKGTKLTEKEWERLCQPGCRMCDAEFTKAEANSIKWLQIATPICHTCAKENAGFVVDMTQNKVS